MEPSSKKSSLRHREKPRREDRAEVEVVEEPQPPSHKKKPKPPTEEILQDQGEWDSEE